VSCACNTAKAPNTVCTLTPGKTYGTCTCTPTSCTVLGVGQHPNDGCGNPIKCGA
jgi:hypothetical protein